MEEVTENQISVIVPVYNGGVKLKVCLKSLSECDPAPMEVIVVADGESDGSWRNAGDYGFRVYTTEKTNGPAFARNIGAEHAKGKLLFFVDSDVSVPENAMTLLMSAFKENPCLAAVTGSYDDAPGESNFMSQYKNLLNHYIHQTADQQAFTFWGACGCIQKKVFDDVGGFDTTYKTAMIEDIELGYRLRERAYEIRLEKKLQVKHLKKWTPKTLIISDILHRAVPWSELILRTGRFNNDLNLKLTYRMSTALVCLSAGLMILWGFTGWFLKYIPVLILCAVALNYELYVFYKHKHGWFFMVKGIIWHLLYYLYSGFSFAYVFIRFKIQEKLKG